MWPFKSIIQNYKDKQRQKENEDVAQSILQYTASNKHPELGTPIDKPIIDEHPELDIALIVAQPGSIFTKAMAPSAYKSIINGLINGEGAQDIMQGIIPVGKIKGATKSMFNWGRAGCYEKSRYNILLNKLEQIPEDRISKDLIKDIKNFYSACKVPITHGNPALRKLYHDRAREAAEKAIDRADNILIDLEREKAAARTAATKASYKEYEGLLGSLVPHDKSLQAIIDSDFVPFDEMKTLFQTGSKAKTTMDFRLSDSYKQGGIISAQYGSKLLNKWQQLYDSKFGKWLRDFMYGQDHDLSDDEYMQKHGHARPLGGSGMLGFLVAPEWEGLEIPEVTAMHYGMKAAPKGISAVETERFIEIPQKVVKAKPVVKPKDPYSKAMKSAFKERTGYDFDDIPEIMKQRELKSWQDYVTRLKQRHKRQ